MVGFLNMYTVCFWVLVSIQAKIVVPIVIHPKPITIVNLALLTVVSLVERCFEGSSERKRERWWAGLGMRSGWFPRDSRLVGREAFVVNHECEHDTGRFVIHGGQSVGIAFLCPNQSCTDRWLQLALVAT